MQFYFNEAAPFDMKRSYAIGNAAVADLFEIGIDQLKRGVKELAMLVGKSLARLEDGDRCPFCDKGGGIAPLLGQRQRRAVRMRLFARFLHKPMLLHLRKHARNGGLVLVTDLAKLCGGHAVGVAVHSKQILCERSLEAVFFHFPAL